MCEGVSDGSVLRAELPVDAAGTRCWGCGGQLVHQEEERLEGQTCDGEACTLLVFFWFIYFIHSFLGRVCGD